MTTINQFFGAIGLDGGSSGSLDSINGGGVIESDGVVVINTDREAGMYSLDSTSGQSESTPSIIEPDADAGTKRWLLTILFGMALKLIERGADPTEPSEGQSVMWMSDGTGKGDDGDILIASKAGGVTKYSTIFDHSAGGAW